MANKLYDHRLKMRRRGVEVNVLMYLNDTPHLSNMNTGTITGVSLGIDEYGTLIFADALGKGWVPAILRRKIVDKKAMNDKKQEIANLLNEWDVHLNDGGKNYSAHVLSISADKFTTVVDEEVEVWSQILAVEIPPRNNSIVE